MWSWKTESLVVMGQQRVGKPWEGPFTSSFGGFSLLERSLPVTSLFQLRGSCSLRWKVSLAAAPAKSGVEKTLISLVLETVPEIWCSLANPWNQSWRGLGLSYIWRHYLTQEAVYLLSPPSTSSSALIPFLFGRCPSSLRVSLKLSG